MAKLWETVMTVSGPEAWEQLLELARLRADIEAIDFAVANAQQAGPDEYATVLKARNLR